MRPSDWIELGRLLFVGGLVVGFFLWMTHDDFARAICAASVCATIEMNFLSGLLPLIWVQDPWNGRDQPVFVALWLAVCLILARKWHLERKRWSAAGMRLSWLANPANGLLFLVVFMMQFDVIRIDLDSLRPASCALAIWMSNTVLFLAVYRRVSCLLAGGADEFRCSVVTPSALLLLLVVGLAGASISYVADRLFDAHARPYGAPLATSPVVLSLASVSVLLAVQPLIHAVWASSGAGNAADCYLAARRLESIAASLPDVPEEQDSGP
jgi:hypothetical protein